MICPLCDSSDWSSVEKNKDGVNLRVQCSNCGFIYQTGFRSESVDYRLADAYTHGHIMREVKIPNDTGVFRVWVSQDKVLDSNRAL
jgi:transcription elongation factor Elf1